MRTPVRICRGIGVREDSGQDIAFGVIETYPTVLQTRIPSVDLLAIRGPQSGSGYRIESRSLAICSSSHWSISPATHADMRDPAGCTAFGNLPCAMSL